jgi:DNA primase catalytic subunit
MNDTANPIILPNSQFRQYRFRLKDGTFIKIKDKIRTQGDLIKYLKKYNPADVYQTASWWLNPQLLGSRIEKKAGFRILQNFFLGMDFIFDFDADDYNSVIEMQENLDKAIANFKSLGLNDYMVMETGRGFQVLFLDFNEWLLNQYPHIRMIANPMDREMAYRAKLIKIVTGLKNKGIKFDYNVSIDTRRIFRVPNTFHRNGKLIKIVYASTLNESEPKGDDSASLIRGVPKQTAEMQSLR